jgi:hypothetical protein
MRSDVRDGGRRQLQIVAATLAAIPFLTGLAGMIAGPSTLPGDNSRLEPSADSEYRFASTFWFAAAPVIWSTVPHIDKQGPRLRAVCGVVFLGGLCPAGVVASHRPSASVVCRRNCSGADRDALAGGVAGQGRQTLAITRLVGFFSR